MHYLYKFDIFLLLITKIAKNFKELEKLYERFQNPKICNILSLVKGQSLKKNHIYL